MASDLFPEDQFRRMYSADVDTILDKVTADLKFTKSDRQKIEQYVATIKALEHANLLAFVMHKVTGEPGVFLAPKERFPSEEAYRTAMTLVAFFDKTGDYDANSKTMSSTEHPISWGVFRTSRVAKDLIKSTARDVGTSPANIERTLSQWSEDGLLKIYFIKDASEVKMEIHDDLLAHSTDLRTRRILAAINAHYIRVAGDEPHVKTYAAGQAPWELALKYKLSLLKESGEMIHALHSHPKKFASLGTGFVQTELNLYGHVIHPALTDGDLFSISEDARMAIEQASLSVPDDTVMDPELLPRTGSGFWAFFPPLDVKTTSTHDKASGLIWRLVPQLNSVQFVAVVVDNNGNTSQSSTVWTWPVGKSLEVALADLKQVYHEAYAEINNTPTRLGWPATENAIVALSKFFMATCVWIRQDIVQLTRGHIERHERKRIQKDHKLAAPPEIQIVALRRTHREGVDFEREETTNTETGAREYRYKWVVKGHHRNQPYGPGRLQRRLIWIDAHVAGPDDKPLKPKPTVIHAVLR